MDVAGLNAEQIAELNLDLTRGDGENAQPLCPPEAPPAVVLDKEALFAGLAASSDRYREVGDNALAIELEVKFALNSSEITEDFDEEIGNAAQFLKENPGVSARIEGHTDNTGTAVYNQWLSERRAQTVRQMMIDKHGIDPGQIIAIGKGQDYPAMSNDTAEGRNANRRVELVMDTGGM
jgi:outer membrane protein OmpA-like peptidoglycan-associated protein